MRVFISYWTRLCVSVGCMIFFFVILRYNCSLCCFRDQAVGSLLWSALLQPLSSVGVGVAYRRDLPYGMAAWNHWEEKRRREKSGIFSSRVHFFLSVKPTRNLNGPYVDAPWRRVLLDYARFLSDKKHNNGSFNLRSRTRGSMVS